MKNTLQATAVIGSLLFAVAAQAQVRPAYQYPDEASARAGIKLGDGPFYLNPYFGFGVGRDDNLFLARNNEVSSTILMFSPGITLTARGRATAFEFKYAAVVGRYPQSDADNYVDHSGRVMFDMTFDRRNFLRIGLDAVRSHDPRGSTDRPVAGRPDVYQEIRPSIGYAFGAPGARGRVELYASEADRRYQNNRATTAAADREIREVGAALYARLATRTYALVEGRHTDIAYKLPLSPSGEEQRLFGGLTWEATAATTGTVKVGRLERETDRGGEDTATVWEGIVSWNPRTYSKFDFFTSRTTNEATGVGRFILSSTGGLSWNHAWSSYFSTGVDLRYQKDEYRGFDRRDEIRSVGLKAGYKFRRWLTLGAEYNHTNRDSSLPIFEYDKNLYMLTATASM